MKRSSNGIQIFKHVLAVTVVLGLTGIGILIWNFNRWPVDMDTLDILSSTHTEREVRDLLGEPSSRFIHTDENGKSHVELTYSRRLSWPIIYVRFDANGKYLNSTRDF